MKILQNNYVCGECGVKLSNPSELTDHIKKTDHNEYFQKYGSIYPNIGMFHYSQTCLRALLKGLAVGVSM